MRQKLSQKKYFLEMAAKNFYILQYLFPLIFFRFFSVAACDIPFLDCSKSNLTAIQVPHIFKAFFHLFYQFGFE